MSNVMFKRGSQATIENLSSYVAGSFYLSTDTDKLYYAKTENNCVLLNQFVKTVSALPTSVEGVEVGDIYYIAGENILAIVNNITDDKIGWAQLNPDTYLATSEQNITLEAIENGIKVNSVIRDSKNHSSIGNFSLVNGDNVSIELKDNNIVINSAGSGAVEWGAF